MKTGGACLSFSRKVELPGRGMENMRRDYIGVEVCLVSAPEGGSGRAAGNRSKGVGVRWVWRPHGGGAGSTGSRSRRS